MLEVMNVNVKMVHVVEGDKMISEINEINEKIKNYLYSPIIGINDRYNYLKELVNNTRRAIGNPEYEDRYNLENVIEEIYGMNRTYIENMLIRLNEYEKVINLAIEIENKTRELQGKVLDGGKLHSMVEEVHRRVSEMYQQRFSEIKEGIIGAYSYLFKHTSNLRDDEMRSSMSDVSKSWNQTSVRGTRDSIAMLKKVLEVYLIRSNGILSVAYENGGIDMDVLLNYMKRVKDVYNEFLSIPTPTEAIEREYLNLKESAEKNKYK